LKRRRALLSAATAAMFSYLSPPRQMIKRIIAIAAFITACAGSDVTDPTGTTPINPILTSMTVSFGTTANLTAEIASTTVQRNTGLMNRPAGSLAIDAGMIFVFAVDQNPAFNGFYMLNTNIPLSIAFIDANNKVVFLDDMAPNTTTIHQAPSVYRYALEVNQGWFASHNVKVGSVAVFTVPAGIVISP
jgi:uncharacterized membrane protein (UPF0127 family)